MAWLTINGIDASAIIGSLATPPAGARRDIGNVAPSAAGFTRLSRQTRKYDLTVKTVPLTGPDAFAWEQLVIGEGQTWDFEGNPTRGFYSSKGLGPDPGVLLAASIVSSGGGASPKFDDCVLRLDASGGIISYQALDVSTGQFTISVWRYESSVWHHYLIRNDGTADGDRWKDGVHDNTLDLSSWLEFDYIAGENWVRLVNLAGSTQDFDGLTILPFNVLDSWIPVFAGATVPYAFLPYCVLGGDVVRENVFGRSAVATVTDTIIMAKPATGGGLQRDMRYLDIVFTQA